MNFVTHNGSIVNNKGVKNMEFGSLADNLKNVKKTNLLSDETYNYIVFRILTNFLNNTMTEKTNHYSKVFNDSILKTFHHLD